MNVKLRNDQKKDASRSRLEADYPDGDILACDFYVPDIEREGREVKGGYQWGRVFNVDHHAPTRRMERRVSSANLAIERVGVCGRPSGAAHIVINHTDCDSVLTAGILAGDLEPETHFGAAAVAADHTGEKNEIADLLQALRQHRDYELSLRNFKLLRGGLRLEKIGNDALAERMKKRAVAEECAREFKMEGRVAYGEFEEDTDGELFLPLLPAAVAILLAVPSKKGVNPRDMKLWLGNAAPEGCSLHALQLSKYDPAYGGRWNAGSDRRDGGTGIPVHEYAKEVARRIDEVLLSLGAQQSAGGDGVSAEPQPCR